MEILFANRTTNGAGDEFPATPDVVGGYMNRSYTVSGTFGGATCTLETWDGAAWTPVPNSAVTAATLVNFSVRQRRVRGVISGASGTTSINARLT